ncbi:hypothetical protein WID10_28375 [Klebsiella variicola]|uniref:hypothetical protein n=1 Tax=Klebsiella variicola TaxID=244366 RepID=UPI00339BDEFF
MKKLVTIVALSIDSQNAVLYLKDGTTLTLKQGDSRLPEIVRIAKAVLPENGECVVDVAEPVLVKQEYLDAEQGTGGLIKFFRVAKKALTRFLNTESPEKVDEGIAFISPLEIGIKPGEEIEVTEVAEDETYALDASASEAPVKAPEPTNAEKVEMASAKLKELSGIAKSTSDPEFHKPLNEDSPDTIVAMNTQTGSVVPHVQKIAPHLKAASKLNDYTGFTNFMKRLEPVIKDRGHSVEDLMKFMERGDLPIADDGCIVIYKRLNERSKDGKTYFVDCHTGNVKQNVGSYVFMKPGLVDPNRRQDCSNGLHVASLSYLGSFGGNVTVVAKVRPEDVFAVPEYNVNKMRVCGYHILERLPEDLRLLVNGGGSISSLPHGKALLNKVLAGQHIGVTQYVEIGGHKGSNITYTDVAKAPETPVAEAESTPAVEPVKETLDLTQAVNEPEVPKAAPVKVDDLAPEIKKTKIDLLWDQFEAAYLAEDLPTAQKFAEELLSTKQKAKKGWAKLGISDEDAELIMSIREASDIKVTTPETKAEATAPVKPEGKAMTVKEQAQDLYRVFKETKAKGNRADTKDAAQELQYFMSSRKKGPKAFGLDAKVSEELKTWLK